MADGIDDVAGDDQTSSTEEAAVRELERLLLVHGPLTVDALAERVTAELPELAAELGADPDGQDRGAPDGVLVDRLATLAMHDDAIWRLPDGRLASVLHHLRRATFTHRVTAGELGREALDVNPDLVALALPRTFQLADGVEVRTATADDEPRATAEGSLLGPARWLAAFTAGDLVAARFDGEQAQLEPIPERDLDEAAGQALVEALGRAYAIQRLGRAPEVHQLVIDTMGAEPTSFAVPVAPLSELLPRAGLRRREAWVGPSDSVWETPPEQARRRRLEEVTGGVEGCCRRAARQALEAWQTWLAATGEGEAPALDPEDAARFADDVDHGLVAPVLAEVATVGRSVVSLRQLGEWAAALAAGSPRAGAGVEYLQAVGADASGDGPTAETHLRSALESDADNPAYLAHMAELVQDRGDAERSLALLRRTGRPPGPDAMAMLQPFLVDRHVGRNDPCPCGSGRKFKTCCAGRPLRRPLFDRCQWLLHKALRRTARIDPFGIDSMRRFLAASGDDEQATGLAADMLLFPGSGLARYLDARGPLLPDDELACARAWPDRPMRLLEVSEVRADGSVDATDVGTGERLDLAAPSVSGPSTAATWTEGATVLVRPLPVDERWLLTSAVVAVPPASHERALQLLEGEVRAFQLVELLVDLQVEAIKAGGLPLPSMAPGRAPAGTSLP